MAIKRRYNKREGFYESLATAGRMDRSIEAGADEHQIVSGAMGLFALALAISGIIPALSPNNMVWGLFMVNGTHTAIHFVTAFLAIYAAVRLDQARTIWRGLAVFFGLMVIAGLFTPSGMAMGMVANNVADTWLHLAKTAVFAWLGWSSWQYTR